MSKNTNTMTAGPAFFDGIWKENPVLVLLLGMCPTLAVTTTCKAALTMGLSATFVLICSNMVISLLRNLLKPHLRILMFTLTIATFVTIADLFLKAYLPEMSESLGPYIPLIIVNCMIICRAEACASKNSIGISALDGIGMGIGFTLALIILASVRELLATGKLFEFAVLKTVEDGGWFVPWAAMSMPVGAFVPLGLILGVVAIMNKKAKA
jgi:electron transport complex protein RnfE